MIARRWTQEISARNDNFCPIQTCDLCFSLSLFSVSINAFMPTGIPSNPSHIPPLRGPSSSKLASLVSWSLSLVCASALANLHSSRSSLNISLLYYISTYFDLHPSIRERIISLTNQVQLTHPDMQQLSGSRGFGGIFTPATIVPFRRLSSRFPGPANREPNTTRAFSTRESSSDCVDGFSGVEDFVGDANDVGRFAGWNELSSSTISWKC